MWAVVLTAVLAQSGSEAGAVQTVVLPFSRTEEYPREKAIALSVQLARLLKKHGISISVTADQVEPVLSQAGAPPLSTCEGHKEGLPVLGRALGVPLVVAVEGSQLGSDLAVHLEALASDDGRRLAKHGFVVPAPGTDSDLERELKPFAAKLEVAVAAMKGQVVGQVAPPKPPPDAPVAAAEPKLVPRPDRGGELAAAKGPGTGVYALAGATAVVGVAAGALAIVAVAKNGSNPYQVTNGASVLSHDQAAAKRDGINTLFTASLVTGIAAACLAAGTAFLWSRSGEP